MCGRSRVKTVWEEGEGPTLWGELGSGEARGGGPEDVVQQKEKMLQGVFTSQSAEFREAIVFYPNGRVRVTAMYDLTARFMFQPISSSHEPRLPNSPLFLIPPILRRLASSFLHPQYREHGLTFPSPSIEAKKARRQDNAIRCPDRV
ncbi:hypothetical protein FA13DRAFT_1717980 [Coprinellus micaceus]|uniref:Uncharacterized protein n=1 Tax=Coprinellus micaceus TaxID=71717 RepID=A0A4Y7SEY7_COPMI|nr:hypothetical protein FA13DRAFT_1717980 [Coprinellus micaceus]